MGFEDLLAIYEEAAAERRDDQGRRPVDCPECGTPLEENSQGQLGCPFDGWKE